MHFLTQNLTCALSDPHLTRDRFFSLYAEAAQKLYTHAQMVLIPPDKLEIRLTDGRTLTVFLEGLWSNCRGKHAEECLESVAEHLRSLHSPIEVSPKEHVHKKNIVAMVKNTDYVEAFGGATSVCEHLVGDLWIVYAIDLPNAIRTINRSELEQWLSCSIGDLRACAVENLRALLGEIEVCRWDSFYMLSASASDYIASILLLDEVWRQVEDFVGGDIIASAPSRDVLLFADLGSKKGMQQLHQKTRDTFTKSSHSVSQTLLRRRLGKWTVL